MREGRPTERGWRLIDDAVEVTSFSDKYLLGTSDGSDDKGAPGKGFSADLGTFGEDVGDMIAAVALRMVVEMFILVS